MPTRKERILEVLEEHGPMTTSEIIRAAADPTLKGRTSISGALTGLRQKGVVVVVGAVADEDGHPRFLWGLKR